MDPKAAVPAPATSNANAAIGELPDISTAEYKFIKPHHFADFFAKNKFSGAAEYAARYFRDLQQALPVVAWLGCYWQRTKQCPLNYNQN